MSKSLIFTRSVVKLQVQQEEGYRLEDADSWELLPFGDSPILHAAWNPVDHVLIVNFRTHKEDFRDVPEKDTHGDIIVNKRTGRPNMKERKVDTYFKAQISDHEAIQAILDNFVVNYTGQDWKIEYKPVGTINAQTIEELQKEIEDEVESE